MTPEEALTRRRAQNALAMRRYRKRHPERVKASREAMRENNKAAWKRWKKRNPEIVRARLRRWKRAHRDLERKHARKAYARTLDRNKLLKRVLNHVPKEWERDRRDMVAAELIMMILEGGITQRDISANVNKVSNRLFGRDWKTVSYDAFPGWLDNMEATP